MRYLLIICTVCAAFIWGVGHYIHTKQLAEAKQSAEDLRPYLAKVEETREYKCKGRCFFTIVTYAANGEVKRSKVGGNSLPIGQTVTVWAKPNFEYAYASPEIYMASQAPSWSPASFLLIPLLAIMGAAASSALATWRKSL